MEQKTNDKLDDNKAMNQIFVGKETDKLKLKIQRRIKYKQKTDYKLGPFETISSTERKYNQLMKMIDDDIDLDQYIKKIKKTFVSQDSPTIEYQEQEQKVDYGQSDIDQLIN